MLIKDYITQEILSIDDYYDALKEAKSRVRFHNSEFTFAHRGKHLSQNAILIEKQYEFIIKRKEK